MAPTTVPDRTNGQAALARPPTGPLALLKKYATDPETQDRLKAMLGKNAAAFTNSIINLVAGDSNLQKCTPASIMKSAMVAASINLPIDKALGFAAIVPYGEEAQFQLMVKGLIQLAIRSGQYRRIHCAEVYKDELKSHNPITGETSFTPTSQWKMRTEGKMEDIAGYYSWFKLKGGFACSNFLTTQEADAHGRRYSKAYQYDMKYNKRASVWSTNPPAMGKKTSLKMLLGRYGILSVEMREAFVAEGEDFASEIQHVESRVLEGPEVGGVEGLKSRMMQERGQNEQTEMVPGAGAEEVTSPEAPAPSAPEGKPVDPTFSPTSQAMGDSQTPAQGEKPKPGVYTCTACHWTGNKLMRGGACPACHTKNVEATADLHELRAEPDLAPPTQAEIEDVTQPKQGKPIVRCLSCGKEYVERPKVCDCGSPLGWKELK